MGCAMGTIRYIIFFFNFLLALAGLGIFIFGVIEAKTDDPTFDGVISGKFTKPAIAFAIVGACVFLFAFFGCCGALRESHCMISTYAVLLLTLFLLQVAVAVVAYMYQGEAKDVIKNGMEEFYSKYGNDSSAKDSIDKFQKNMKCCGSTSPDEPWATLGINKPDSCFPDKANIATSYDVGCIPKLEEKVEQSLTNIARLAIIVGVIEVVGIIFSLCLANTIRRSELRGYA